MPEQESSGDFRPFVKYHSCDADGVAVPNGEQIR